MIFRRQVRAVLFDAVGTLLRPEPAVAVAYAAAGRRHGAMLDDGEAGCRFQHAVARQDELDRRLHANRTCQAREVDRWRQIVADVFAGEASVDAIFADLWQHFASPASFRLFDDAASSWQRLAGAGVTVGIASNFDDRLIAICRATEPLAACPHVFVSSQVGWRKPGQAFFAAIEERLGLTPAELMLVGDDLENDYRAALAAGWQAVLVDRAESHNESVAIGSLAELPDLVLAR